jgi:hypothetical protein
MADIYMSCSPSTLPSVVSSVVWLPQTRFYDKKKGFLIALKCIVTKMEGILSRSLSLSLSLSLALALSLSLSLSLSLCLSHAAFYCLAAPATGLIYE